MCLVKLKTHELSHRGLPTLERHIEKKFSIDPPIDGPMDHPFPYLINLNGLLIDFL